MSLDDMLQIGIGLLITGLVVTAAILFPVYEVNPPGHSQSEFVRRPIWDPPTIKVGHAFANVSSDELERLKKDPVQAKAIEKWKDMPKEIPLRPNIFAFKGSRVPNLLGAIAGYGMVAYLGFVIYKFVNRG